MDEAIQSACSDFGVWHRICKHGQFVQNQGDTPATKFQTASGHAGYDAQIFHWDESEEIPEMLRTVLRSCAFPVGSARPAVFAIGRCEESIESSARLPDRTVFGSGKPGLGSHFKFQDFGI